MLSLTSSFILLQLFLLRTKIRFITFLSVKKYYKFQKIAREDQNK